MPHNSPWWRNAVVYQVYIRSFVDTDGDGIGDLDGVRSKLDDLDRLGVDAIWLSPIFPSAMRDAGYDVTDYETVDPTYGGLDSFDRLLAAAHMRGIRVVLDWVPNHTSTDHPWFVESASSTDNPKRDWYVWADGRGDGPPNNWQSCFADVGPAWTRHGTGQWYLHSFLVEQADLNWDNPDVEAAMHDVMRFWLDRGVDGFRIDVVHNLGKDPALTDNPELIVRPTAATAGRRFDEDYWPNLWPKVERLRAVIDEYPDRVVIGETYVLDSTRLAAYVAPSRLHLAHDFTLTEIDWEADALAGAIRRSNDALGQDAWPAWILSSHDHGRLASRWTDAGALANGETDSVVNHDRAEAALAVLMLMRGTAFLFQGEELALPDARVPAERRVDIDGRDRSRVPLPWEDGAATPHGGFTTAEPWLPIDPAVAVRHRAGQEADSSSSLTFVRELIRVRHDEPAVRTGTQQVTATDGVITFLRSDPNSGQTITLHVNTGANPVAVRLARGARTRLLRRAAEGCGQVTLGVDGVAVVEGAM